MAGRNGLGRWLPGLRAIARLRPGELPRELMAGATVATVGIPIGLANAALAGLPPVYGLYAAIVPTLVYALRGPSSRYLIVGPDTTVCLLLGAILTQLGLSAGEERAAAAAGLALLVGLGCLAASALRLGFLANLISRPVLVGYSTGVAILLLASQVPHFTGFAFETHGILRQTVELVRRAAEIHGPSMIVGVGLFAMLRVGKKYAPGVPGLSLALLLAVLVCWLLDFRSPGLATIGAIPSGLPAPALPTLEGDPRTLTLAVLSLLIVSFSSGIMTERSFGQRLGVVTHPNREFAGFGAADIAGGLFQGFVVTGDDGRTGVALDLGGRSPLVGVSAAIGIALAVTLFAGPLSFLPKAVIGAILASIAVDLFDARAFGRLRRIDPAEFAIALVATAGVVWTGVVIGVFFSVVLTLAHLLKTIARPRDALVGRTEKDGELVTLTRHEKASMPDRIIVYLFESSILFVNAEFFRRRSLAALRKVPDAGWFVLDASAMMNADSAAVDALTALKAKLDSRNIVLLVGGGHGLFNEVLERSGVAELIGRDRLFPTPAAAVAAAERLRDAEDKKGGKTAPRRG